MKHSNGARTGSGGRTEQTQPERSEDQREIFWVCALKRDCESRARMLLLYTCIIYCIKRKTSRTTHEPELPVTCRLGAP